MNDNDILLASQNGCELVLTTDGDFPPGSKVLYCGDKTYDLTNVADGTNMFKNDTNLNVDFDVDLPSLTDSNSMFFGCANLISFSGSIPNLTNGRSMFSNCSNLASWTVELPKLTVAGYMFDNCTELTMWNVGLPKLEDGYYMFRNCSKLTSFTAELPSLTNGDNMFYNCTGLTSFSADLPSLTNSSSMFLNCTSLTSFSGDLSSLTTATSMFQSCILDEASVLRILNSIPAHTSGTHRLHLGKRTNYLDSTEIAALLNTTTPIGANTNYSYKGWKIIVQE